MLSASLAVAISPVHASERWSEAGSGAVAILPAPQEAHAITRGSFYCEEQRWSFLFRLEQGSLVAGTTAASRIVIGDEVFEGKALEEAGSLLVEAVPEMLGPMKTGSRMRVAIGDKGALAQALFPLAGSRTVIETIAPLCSQVDMSAYRPVLLAEAGDGIADATRLMAEEAQLFRAATGRQPAIASALVSLEEGRRLLFASLCGSTSYYGQSGCTLSGFAAESGEDWREVYNTEGVLMHLDPNALNLGWPNLVTLPTVGGVLPYHWVWNGTEYDNVEAIVAEDDSEPVEEEGDSAR